MSGTPGTGKTSFVKALCEKYNKNLYILNLANVTDEILEYSLGILPKNAMVLIEDIDTYTVSKKRSTADDNDEYSEFKLLTLSGLLNAIDGVLVSDGRILIATTNHINKLDPALTRNGRFNLKVILENLVYETFIKFFSNFFPDFNISENTKFKENISPADMQATIMDNIDNPQKVLDFCKI